MNAGAGSLLGIDIGTSELKAALFDSVSGEMVASAVSQLAVRAEADGTREQQPSDVLNGLRQVTRRLQADAGIAWGQVKGIGLAAQGGSAILCDRRSGEALTPMQLWNDTRPLYLLNGIAIRRPEGYWQRLSRLPEPGAGLARILWLRHHYPLLVPTVEYAQFDPSMQIRSLDAGGNDQSHSIIYCGAGEFAFFALAGQWRQDAGNALQIGCYSVPGRTLEPDALAVVEAPPDFVAPLRQGHETHPLSVRGGELLDLPPSIPVAGPYIDHEAGYLSVVGNGRQPLLCSMGTAWVGSFITEDVEPSPNGADLVLPSPLDERSLMLRVMAAGNLTWDWGLDILMGSPRSDALEQADHILEENLLPPDGLVSFPWFTSPNTWEPALPGNGGFLGLTPRTTRADLLRALAAGMAFEFFSLFEKIKTTRLVDGVVLTGGASKGSGFRQLLSALFAPLPVYNAVDQHMAGARGSIYAFDPATARCALNLVPRPNEVVLGRIKRQYNHYLIVRKSIRINER